MKINIHEKNKIDIPSRTEIYNKFQELIMKKISQEDIASWAAIKLGLYEDQIEDDAIWKALCNLSIVDFRHSPNGPYMYTEMSFKDWFQEFEDACAENPIKE